METGEGAGVADGKGIDVTEAVGERVGDDVATGLIWVDAVFGVEVWVASGNRETDNVAIETGLVSMVAA